MVRDTLEIPGSTTSAAVGQWWRAEQHCSDALSHTWWKSVAATGARSRLANRDAGGPSVQGRRESCPAEGRCSSGQCGTPGRWLFLPTPPISILRLEKNVFPGPLAILCFVLCFATDACVWQLCFVLRAKYGAILCKLQVRSRLLSACPRLLLLPP